MDVRDKAVLITGASQGLGEALAQKLAEQGARVAMVARRPGPLGEAVRRIREKGGVAHALAFDVGDKGSAHAIVAAAADLVGDLDVLVQNASTLGPLPMPLLLDTACEDLEDVLRTNVVGPFRLAKIVTGSMLLRERGVVVQVSSDAAVAAYPRWGAYSIAKAAADHMTRIFAAEAKGVKLFSVDPGEMDTEMHALAMPDADRSTLARPEAVAAEIAQMIRRSDRIESGARLVAGAWSAS